MAHKRDFPIRFTYKSKAVIGLATLCLVVQIINALSFGAVNGALENRPLKKLKVWEVHRFFGFAVTHRNMAHLMSNMSAILLLGPDIEKRLGYQQMLNMFAVGFAVTGVLNSAVFGASIVGVNSVVFSMLILYTDEFFSFSNRSEQVVPLTNFLLVLFWSAKEIGASMSGGTTAGLAHILGGVAAGEYRNCETQQDHRCQKH